MNLVVYTLTGVHPIRVSPQELQDLSSKFDTVREAALESRKAVRTTIDSVLAQNQGEAPDMFRESVTGGQSSLRHLDELAEAALRTRTAHASAAHVVGTARTAMDSIANETAWALLRVHIPIPLPPLIGGLVKQRILSTARRRLLAVSKAARQDTEAAYDAVSLPALLPQSHGQRRGSLPDGVQEQWAEMSTDDRIDLLEAMYDDVTQDWAEEDRPPIIYYSDQPKPPEGAVERPSTFGENANGAASPTKRVIYLNVDKITAEPPGANPDGSMIHTVAHELHHIQQFQLRDQYDDLVSEDKNFVEDVRAGRRSDPFADAGSTLDEVERIRNQQRGSEDFYLHRPGEVGARRSATEYVDDLTTEKMAELLP